MKMSDYFPPTWTANIHAVRTLNSEEEEAVPHAVKHHDALVEALDDIVGWSDHDNGRITITEGQYVKYEKLLGLIKNG